MSYAGLPGNILGSTAGGHRNTCTPHGPIHGTAEPGTVPFRKKKGNPVRQQDGAGDQVPISQLHAYFFWAFVSLSMDSPSEASLRFATCSSISFGTSYTPPFIFFPFF